MTHLVLNFLNPTLSRMKTFRPILAGFCFLLVAQATALAANIATINLQVVFEDYYKTIVANERLKESAAEMTKEFGTLREQGQSVEKLYRSALERSNDQAVSAAEREKNKQEAEAKLLEMRSLERSMKEFERQAEATLKERERRVRDNILDEIKAVVSTLAKARGYSLVINSKAESVFQAPVVLYSTDENDITKEILEQLNAGAPEGVLEKGKP